MLLKPYLFSMGLENDPAKWLGWVDTFGSFRSRDIVCFQFTNQRFRFNHTDQSDEGALNKRAFLFVVRAVDDSGHSTDRTIRVCVLRSLLTNMGRNFTTLCGIATKYQPVQ